MRLDAYYQRTSLREVLESQERNQAWLARKVGCSESFVSRILTGERRIPVWFAERASDVLGLPVHVLFFDLVLTTESDILTSEAVA